jgi:hypothetical protein
MSPHRDPHGPDFDARWRELTRRARSAAPADSTGAARSTSRSPSLSTTPSSVALANLVRAARERELEAVPFLSPRSAWALAAAAALLTVWFAPRALSTDDSRPMLDVAQAPVLPPPPSLPPPPALEAPSYYLAKAEAAWKEFTP